TPVGTWGQSPVRGHRSAMCRGSLSCRAADWGARGLWTSHGVHVKPTQSPFHVKPRNPRWSSTADDSPARPQPTWFGSRDPTVERPGRLRYHADPVLGDPSPDHAQPPQGLLRLGQLLGRRPTLDGDEGPLGIKEGEAPPRQLVDPADRSGRDPRRRQVAVDFLGATTMHTGVGQSEIGDGLDQPLGTPEHRFDEVQLEVRSGDGQGQAGEPGAGPDVDDPRPGREGVLDDGAVEDVSLPEDVHPPGPDEAVTDTRVGKDCGERFRRRKALTEESVSAFRCNGRLSRHGPAVSRETPSLDQSWLCSEAEDAARSVSAPDSSAGCTTTYRFGS